MRLLSLGLGTLILVLDFLSKAWVKNTAWLHYYPIVEGFFTIQYATNEGIAFGFFHDSQWQWKSPLLAAMAVLAVVMVLYYVWTTPPHEKLVFVSLGLLLGGILGNFVDRLLHRSVVDFVKLHWGSDFAWPTFNLADSAITSGVLLILVSTFVYARRDAREEKDSVAVE